MKYPLGMKECCASGFNDGENEKRASEIARGVISNDLTGTETKGNYITEFNSKESSFHGRITGFDRKNINIWRLIHEALIHVMEKVS